ncbi:Ribosomal RNA small subunit methyltransferase E [Corynebacterium ciconiae DSM 44920]|uniref:16S rRNA (uracil(1498)-N(3))-methyltransferase n=1 Tax=Corynebacterium ciconiae TaxID=227319 RepID=UPI00037DE542|nr:16S rRNA (uracil(1498)-N(3))-methyltransferase [Corynebacterium ciconiae]WKD60666.1 Ribosomal RNA small subunit methyltransferase E [Corynebacterium ciconiae DSM 44920]
MSLPVFIDSALSAAPPVGTTLELRGQEATHAGTVMRLGQGDQLRLSNGRGLVLRCTIAAPPTKQRVQLSVSEVEETTTAQPRVSIVQALPKSERAELAVDLATQGGVDSIIPWQASRCIAKWPEHKRAKLHEKWVTAAIAAAKQSRRAFVPEVEQLHQTADIVQRVRAVIAAGGRAYVLHEDARTSLATAEVDVNELVLIIGPEGGISDHECAEFHAAGAESVLLGPEVLRTASAGLVALAAIGSRTSRWHVR